MLGALGVGGTCVGGRVGVGLRGTCVGGRVGVGLRGIGVNVGRCFDAD